MNSEVDFPLTTGVPYAKNGEEVEGVFIKLHAPSAKQLKECTTLKQAFFQAISAFQDREAPKTETKDDANIDGEAIISALYMSDVDMVKVLLNAKELFVSGVALIDGEIKLTRPILDAMSQDDLEAMTGEYMANFILSSVLKNLK